MGAPYGAWLLATRRKMQSLKLGIKALVKLLKDDSTTTQAQAAGALWEIAISNKHRAAVAGSGAIKPLVALLSRGSSEGQANSCSAVWYLAMDDANTEFINKAGAIAPLTALLESRNEVARTNAAKALKLLEPLKVVPASASASNANADRSF